jgi:hypothetical protein
MRGKTLSPAGRPSRIGALLMFHVEHGHSLRSMTPCPWCRWPCREGCHLERESELVDLSEEMEAG